MASATTPYSFRRKIGRAASPPTWACYEQISYDDEDHSESDSCSEDEEDYSHRDGDDSGSDAEDGDRLSMSQSHGNEAHDVDNMDMEIDEVNSRELASKKDLAGDKGKQRAIEPEPESPPRKVHRRKSRHRVQTLRPILTIHRSQGFVWNQDLFIPPYIKDRYVASTSPPNSMGFLSTSASSTTSGLNDYEIEVVEIRVQEGDLGQLIP
ncbi:hypothetical protein C8J56DRAFT_968719 [Mycena floridula]|nr:hypothetical protein C8J56DRAFT_968719 [Mycena floridula]